VEENPTAIFYINNIYIFTRGEKKGERETELKRRKNYKSR
jgi:hypothetical protein